MFLIVPKRLCFRHLTMCMALIFHRLPIYIVLTLLFAYIYIFHSYTIYHNKDHEEIDEKSFAGSSNYSFHYIINEKKFCHRRGYNDQGQKKKTPKTLIIVHSKVDHFESRQVIRETWGHKDVLSKRYNMALIFFTGNTFDQEIQQQLMDESKMFDDIIQASYIDAYKNLTYKAVSWLRWINDYCYPTDKIDFILKVDDDVVVNTENIFAYLNERYALKDERSIYCMLWQNLTVERNNTFRYSVNQEDFEGTNYPTYCSGSGYILTSDLSPNLYEQSLISRFFWIDDIYVTGILVEDLKKRNSVEIRHRDLSGRYILSTKLLNDKFLQSYAMFIHLPSGAGVRNWFWKEIQRMKPYYKQYKKHNRGDTHHNIVRFANVALKT